MRKLIFAFTTLALLAAPVAWASNALVVTAPEPGTLLLLGTGLAALVPVRHWLKK